VSRITAALVTGGGDLLSTGWLTIGRRPLSRCWAWARYQSTPCAKYPVVTAGHHDHSRSEITEGQDSAWGMISIYLVPAKERDTHALALRDELVALYDQREGYQRLSVRVARPDGQAESGACSPDAGRSYYVQLICRLV
jgi:hypothetical protein